jgi:putative tricarboxylic transport membrane protein
MTLSRRAGVLASAFAALFFSLLADVHAQSAWRPEKPVEIIVPTGAGGINDLNARLIQKTLQDAKLVPTPVLIMNKPGGNQSLAVVYLNQHPADPHYLLYSTATLFTNQLAGVSPVRYSDLTPLALLLVDYTVVTVSAKSPLKSMRDLVAKLKADPESISFGLVSRGGPNHLAVAQAMRSAGIDPKKLKLVVFKTNAESLTAVIGGHIQAVVSSVSAALPQVEAGNARMLGIAAAQRQGGSLANLPTMREQGIDATGISNWRGILAAKDLTAPQIAFWGDALARVTSTAEWKQQLDHNNLESRFMRSREFSAWLDNEYAATRAVMADLGLVK